MVAVEVKVALILVEPQVEVALVVAGEMTVAIAAAAFTQVAV